MHRAGVVLLSIAACADPSADPRAGERHLPTPAERAAASPSSAERMFPPVDAAAPIHRNAQLATVWSRVIRTSGCFFFSGPDGRDDQLAGPARIDRNGEAVTIAIGDAVFIGTFHAGELRASRQSQHDSLGAWTVSEALHGQYREGTMTADYRYTECGPGGACPGACTIRATVSFRR